MRVLYLQAGNLYGGVESTLVTIARYRHLCPEMEPHFAVCFEGRLTGELIAAGATVSILGETRIRNPLSVWRVRRALSRLLRREKFDVVVGTSAWLQAIFGPVVKSAALPLVYWFHEPMRGQHWLERWASLTEPELALCNSRFTASTVHNMYPSVKTELLYNPVCHQVPRLSKAQRAAVRNELQTPVDAVVIIQVSRMVELKGHAQLLDALGKLNDLPDWVCWIVGGGQRPLEESYFEQIKRQAIKLGLSSRIHFPGERADAKRLLAAADIYCQPNAGPESFGNIFIEALFSGLPVVTTNIGGAREIINASCGILVPPLRSDTLADSLRSLIQDEALRAKLGAAGQIRAGDLCDVTQQIEELSKILAVVHQAHRTEIVNQVLSICDG